MSRAVGRTCWEGVSRRAVWGNRIPRWIFPAPLPGRGSSVGVTGGSLRFTTGYHPSPLRGANPPEMSYDGYRSPQGSPSRLPPRMGPRPADRIVPAPLRGACHPAPCPVARCASPPATIHRPSGAGEKRRGPRRRTGMRLWGPGRSGAGRAVLPGMRPGSAVWAYMFEFSLRKVRAAERGILTVTRSMPVP